jgi:predicted flap endonuclease-1-like 5' DNA nuclease
MSQGILTAVIAVLVIVGALILFLRFVGGKAPPARPPVAAAEQSGVISSAASAVEDVAGSFMGVDAHPDLAGPPDDLTTIKGLGPKAAAQLKLLGITRFAQLGALGPSECSSIDEHMGVFRGRLERDRWVEQARYLSRGDTATFEREFGKLG